MNVGRFEIENALDNGNLWAVMATGRYWKVRRNGVTKTWKREPLRFNIPVAAGLKSCGYVSNENCVSYDRTGDFIISDTDPNKI